MPAKLRMRNELGMTLSLLRQLRGWGQEDLAAASRVGLAMIRKIEQGRRQLTADNLAAVAAALGVDLSTVHELVALVRKIQGAPASGPALAAGATPQAIAATASPAVLRQLQGLLRSDLLAAPGRRIPLAFEDSRRLAPDLWKRLKPYPDAARQALLQEAAEFQDAGLVVLLCDRRRTAALDSVDRAHHLAELAVLGAEHLPGDATWRKRLQGYARAHLANALRVAGRLPAAKEELARALELWRAGAASDPGILNAARILHLEASLLRGRRETARALVLLDEASAIDRWGETPSLLIGKAKVVEEMGQFTESIALLRQAASRIDGDSDPVTIFLVHLNLGTNLCHLGRHAEAAQGLEEVRSLALGLGNQLDSLRVGWLEAKIAAGLGQSEKAFAAYERVRADFEEQGIAYDCALVTLEVAELHATLGHTAEVKELARRSAPMFSEQEVHSEAQRALALFLRAAEEERVSVELIRAVLAYLERSRRDPELRYRGPG